MRQRHLLFGLVVGASLLSATSCADSAFLDETQTSDLSKEVIFGDSAYTAGFLNHIYEKVGFDVEAKRFGSGGLQTASDEAEFRLNTSNDGVQFATGTVNAVTISKSVWETCYKNIRAVNVFLQNADACPMMENAKVIYKAEARFLRAWYYFILLRHYGGVPLLGDMVYDNDNYEEINMTRASFADVVDYIKSELKIAAADLPAKRTGNAFGRASALACDALLARLNIYIASPLYNGTTQTDAERLKPLMGYTEFSNERWKDAAEAAGKIITSGQFQIYARHQDDGGKAEPGWGYYAQFKSSDFVNQDSYNGKKFKGGATCGIIFCQKKAVGHYHEQAFCPPTAGGNGDGGYPTFELVESYPMLDGKSIDDNSGKYYYGKNTDKYASRLDCINSGEFRDPRYKISITWNGATTFAAGNNTTIYTYKGVGQTSDAIGSGTRTGFYIHKMLHRASAGNWFVGTPQELLLIRYSEILLNYAEAVNEYYGPNAASVVTDADGKLMTPLECLRQIREGAGIEPGDDGNYGLNANMSQDEMREAIRLERRIELAFEGHRFFDVRRWMIAEETDNATLHGLEVTKKLDGSVSSRTIAVRQRVFRKAMYFWPLPYEEVVRSEDLLQNPYYE